MIGDGNIEIGAPMCAPNPSEAGEDDSEYTWHVHEDQVMDPTWGTGAKCPECWREPKDHGDDKKVNWSIHRLKADNAAGVSQRERTEEVYQNARDGGYDITRA